MILKTKKVPETMTTIMMKMTMSMFSIFELIPIRADSFNIILFNVRRSDDPAGEKPADESQQFDDESVCMKTIENYLVAVYFFFTIYHNRSRNIMTYVVETNE